jgi:hypothetical protein
MAKVDGRANNDPSLACAVHMQMAAERWAEDPKRLAKALRVVRAGLRLGIVTAEDILAVQGNE